MRHLLIKDELFKKIKEISKDTGIKIHRITEEAIKQYLKSKERKRKFF